MTSDLQMIHAPGVDGGTRPRLSSIQPRRVLNPVAVLRSEPH